MIRPVQTNRYEDLHIPDGVMAELVDYGPDSVSPDVMIHLARCARCTAAWAAASEHRGRLLRNGLPQPVAVGIRRWRPVVMPAAMMAVAAAIVFVLVSLPVGDMVPFPPDPLLTEKISDASTGGMIFPGARAAAPGNGLHLRSASRTDREVYHYLGDLGRRRLADPDDMETNRRLVAGWLVAGQVGTANEVSRVVLIAHPEDPVLRQLAAIGAWRESHLVTAEALLRDLHAEQPDNEIIRFNLALLLLETGRTQAACRLLDGLPTEASDPVVRARLADLRPIS